MGESRVNSLIAAIGAKPCFGGLMDGVERGDFDEDIGSRGKLAVDELEIAERSEKGSAARSFFLPSLAGREAESGKKAAPAGRKPRRCRRAAGMRCP